MAGPAETVAEPVGAPYISSLRPEGPIVSRGERSESLENGTTAKSPARGERIVTKWFLSPLPGLIILQYPTRGSLRSPLAIYSRPSGADHGNTQFMGLQGILQQPRPAGRPCYTARS